MRTNIEIDDDLINDALQLTGAKTKREVVDLALKSLVMLRKQEKIRRFRGKLKWEGNLDKTRED